MRVSPVQGSQMNLRAGKSAPAARNTNNNSASQSSSQATSDKVTISKAGRAAANQNQAAAAGQQAGMSQGTNAKDMAKITTNFSERSGVTFGGKG